MAETKLTLSFELPLRRVPLLSSPRAPPGGRKVSSREGDPPQQLPTNTMWYHTGTMKVHFHCLEMKISFSTPFTLVWHPPTHMKVLSNCTNTKGVDHVAREEGQRQAPCPIAYAKGAGLWEGEASTALD